MIKAILFDFDGTIANTNELIFDSYRYAFKTYFDRDLSDSEIANFYGVPLTISMAHEGKDHIDALTKIYLDYNMANHDRLIRPFPGINEGLNILKQKGYKLGIVTSKRIAMLERGLSFLKLNDFFDVMVTPELTKSHKPDPEPVLKACQMLNILPHEAIMVGDSVYDLQSGKRAGAFTASVNYHVFSQQIIDNEKADFSFDNLHLWAQSLDAVK